MAESQFKQPDNETNNLVVKKAYELASEIGLGQDCQRVIALFYDDRREEDIKEECTAEEFEMLCSLKKLDETNQNEVEIEAENIRKMFFAIAKDVRVVFIKLCIVLATLEMKSMDNITRHNYALSALNLYAPLAGRLGLSTIKSKLEDLSFLILHPREYRKIEEEVANRFSQREEKVEHLKSLVKKLADDLGIEATIMGRKKHIYSIYKKLLTKKTLDTIYDLIAVRAIVPTVADCYSLLGRLHSEVTPISNRFKDYIAIPKSNGYRSLHTTLIFEGVPVEVQIRTMEMHRHAEYGFAAHWIYKEKRQSQNTLDVKLGWIRELLEKGDKLTGDELKEALKVDIYDGEIFVQTPKGKVLHLPKDSTPIDFAYAIHSEIGNKLVGAKVNGKMVPTNTRLTNGNVVEIITNPASKGPSRDWLKIVKTSEAKSKINAFFKKEMREENIKLGYDMLFQTIKENGFAPNKLLEKENLLTVFKKYNFQTEDELLSAIGFGSLSAKVIANNLVINHQKTIEKQIPKKVELSTNEMTPENQEHNVAIEGVEGLSLKFAKCCRPMPGDEIVGFLSVGRGIVVHRKICPNVQTFDENRLVSATWKKK